MRKKRATRWNAPQEHNSYGIYNWFKLKGISDVNVMKEVMYAFCEKEGFAGLSVKTPEKTITNFIANRFQKFATFGGAYLKENNYANN